MLINDKIRVRQVKESDLDALIPLINNLDARGEFLPRDMTSPQQIRQEFRENGMSTDEYERLLIVDEHDSILGTVWHFKSVPYFNAREIGYVLFDMEKRGQGIVSQAVSLVVSYLFQTTHLNRLELRMDMRNKASEKVAINCGFTKEGVSRGANYVWGEHVDMYIYALLREEWRE